MEDWDAEEFEPIAPVVKAQPLKSNWDDEDVEEDDVKESWEEEEEKPKPQPVEKPAEKPAPKPSAKSAAKKGKQPSTSTEVVEDDVMDDPTLEKLRRQRLVEEADFKSTAELFASKKDGSEKLLETFIPKSESDFAEYAELIANKIRPYEKSFHYMGLLKNVMRLSMTSLKGADAKEISSSVTAIANEKIKAEKEAAAGKKKGGAKKKQLHIEKGEEEFVAGSGGGGYDDPDEFDFM